MKVLIKNNLHYFFILSLYSRCTIILTSKGPLNDFELSSGSIDVPQHTGDFLKRKGDLNAATSNFTTSDCPVFYADKFVFITFLQCHYHRTLTYLSILKVILYTNIY